MKVVVTVALPHVLIRKDVLQNTGVGKPFKTRYVILPEISEPHG